MITEERKFGMIENVYLEDYTIKCLQNMHFQYTTIKIVLSYIPIFNAIIIKTSQDEAVVLS